MIIHPRAPLTDIKGNGAAGVWFRKEQRLKIGLVGYYNFGNYGDELFAEVYREVFSDCQITVLPNINSDPIFDPALVAQQDCIIIGGGDLVIPYAFADLYWDDVLLTKPIYIIGVGVPTWGGYSKEVVIAMRRFFQHENIKLVTARDPKSRDWIIKQLQPKVPVTFYPDIVAALNFKRKSHHELTLGIILRAHQDIDYSNLEGLLARAASFGYDIHNIVLGVGKVAEDDLPAAEQLNFPFSRIIVRQTIGELTDEIARCDVIVSQKFHALVVAMMMGIPCISLSQSDKFVSWFEFFGKELFLSLANDQRLPHRLIRPMYEISAEDVARIKAHAREGLLYARNSLLGKS